MTKVVKEKTDSNHKSDKNVSKEKVKEKVEKKKDNIRATKGEIKSEEIKSPLEAPKDKTTILLDTLLENYLDSIKPNVLRTLQNKRRSVTLLLRFLYYLDSVDVDKSNKYKERMSLLLRKHKLRRLEVTAANHDVDWLSEKDRTELRRLIRKI